MAKSIKFAELRKEIEELKRQLEEKEKMAEANQDLMQKWEALQDLKFFLNEFKVPEEIPTNQKEKKEAQEQFIKAKGQIQKAALAFDISSKSKRGRPAKSGRGRRKADGRSNIRPWRSINDALKRVNDGKGSTLNEILADETLAAYMQEKGLSADRVQEELDQRAQKSGRKYLPA